MSWGVNLIVIGQDIPAETLPGGVYIISKKSLIVSFKGKILKLLNVNDPLVNYITIVWGFPTSKSFYSYYFNTLNIISAGLGMNAYPSNFFPWTIWSLYILSLCFYLAFSKYSFSRIVISLSLSTFWPVSSYYYYSSS